jgi:hypothetical protein
MINPCPIFAIYKLENRKRRIMKKLFIVLVSLGLALGASAQHFRGGGGYYNGGPRIGVGFGFYAPFYPFGYPYGYYPYGPYGYGYGNGYGNSRLNMQIQDIKSEYKGKIWAVKEDKTLTHKQKRQQIIQLKLQRDETIDQAKRNYYRYPPSRQSTPPQQPAQPAPSAPPAQ